MLRTLQPNAFQWAGQPPKLPLPVGDLHPNLIHGSLGPCEPAPKRHLGRFSRVCTAQPCVQQTDKTWTDT